MSILPHSPANPPPVKPNREFEHASAFGKVLPPAMRAKETLVGIAVARTCASVTPMGESPSFKVPDVFTKEKRSTVMAAIRSSGNKDTEVRFMAILRASKIRGWRRRHPAPGRPDFVFLRERVAVFVDGCFWHGCPRHGRKPGSNVDYWHSKLARNKARDKAVTITLRRAGWTVLRFWEHELGIAKTVESKVARALAKNPVSRAQIRADSVSATKIK